MVLLINIKDKRIKATFQSYQNLMKEVESSNSEINFNLRQDHIELQNAFNDQIPCDEVMIIAHLIELYPQKFSNFSITFDQNFYFNKQSSKILTKFLQNVEKIEHLTIIDYFECQGNLENDSIYPEIMKQRNILDNIQFLKINLNSVNIISFVDFLVEVRNLKNLDINFGWDCFLQNSGAIVFGETLSKCQNLEQCKISLSKCNFLNKEGEKAIAEGLLKCKKLYSYSFYTGDHDNCNGQSTIDVLKHSKTLIWLSIYILGQKRTEFPTRQHIKEQAKRQLKHLVVYE